MATSRRYPISCALGLVLGGLACQAMAEPPAAAPSNNNGIMTFPNVRVVNAPAAAQEPAADAASMQAFIDPITGELRAPTAEEAKQLSDAASARTRAGILTNRSVTNAATDDSERVFYGPGNIVGVMLDDRDMVFQKVHVDADGNLIQECVTGEDDATHAAHDHDHQQESHNDR